MTGSEWAQRESIDEMNFDMNQATADKAREKLAVEIKEPQTIDRARDDLSIAQESQPNRFTILSSPISRLAATGKLYLPVI